MTLLLLPGADGKGLLFKPLLERIAQTKTSAFNAAEIAIVDLNYDESDQLLNQSLAMQAARIENEYDGRAVIIIAESYSGLLANDLLQQRLEIISTAKVSNVKVDVPCLYLQARQDNLVAAKNIAPFRQLFANFECQIVEGTQFLLQTNPKQAWHAIDGFLLD